MYEAGDLRQSQSDVKEEEKKYTSTTTICPPVKVKLQPHIVRFLPKEKKKQAQLAKRNIQKLKKIPVLFTQLIFFFPVPCRI